MAAVPHHIRKGNFKFVGTLPDFALDGYLASVLSKDEMNSSLKKMDSYDTNLDPTLKLNPSFPNLLLFKYNIEYIRRYSLPIE